MTEHTQALLQDALTLPPDQRAELVHDLLSSLEPAPVDDPDAVASAWNHELRRRARDVRSGDTPGNQWPAVRDRLVTELTGE